MHNRLVAIEKGDIDVIRAILNLKGVNVNDKVALPETHTYTIPIHLAATYKQCHVIPILVFMGADVNARDGVNDVTALHVAAAGGQLASVQNLINCKANISATRKDGKTALDIAEGLPDNNNICNLLRTG